jgi:hypothetical protein
MGKKILTLRMVEVEDNFEPRQQTEVSVHLDGDVLWDKMLPFFLHFLEGAGYVGVVETMSKLLGGDVYDYETYFPIHIGEFDEE